MHREPGRRDHGRRLGHALASEVDKCIAKKVPTVVTDGDLSLSERLTYLGTDWYNLGCQDGQCQCR